MKHYTLEFLRRGFAACGIGPLVLAIVYLISHEQGVIDTLTVHQVCVGIVSLSALAFIVGGMNVIYQIERIPLMVAILIHGIVLYISYLATYLINDWLAKGMAPFLIFTGIFIIGYLAIWAIIYATTRRNAAKLNEQLKKKQQSANTL